MQQPGFVPSNPALHCLLTQKGLCMTGAESARSELARGSGCLQVKASHLTGIHTPMHTCTEGQGPGTRCCVQTVHVAELTVL